MVESILTIRLFVCKQCLCHGRGSSRCEKGAEEVTNPIHEPGLPQPGTPPLPEPVATNPEFTAYLRNIWSQAGLTTLAWIAGTVVAVGVIGGLLLVSALMSSGEASGVGLGTLISGLLLGIGVSLGGGLGLNAQVESSLFEASGQASIAVVPLGIVVLLAAGIAIVGRWRQRVDRTHAPSHVAEAARAAIEAGVVGVLMLIITAFARLREAPGMGGFEVATRPMLVFVLVWVVVAATLWTTRTLVSARERAVPVAGLARFGPALRESGQYLTIQFAVFGTVALVGLILGAAQSESIAPVLLGLPILGNLAAAAAALGHFGGVGVGTGGFGGVSMGPFDVPNGVGIWLIVITVLTLVVSAIWVGVRRPRLVRPDWSRVWQMPVVVFGVWCVLALGLASVSMAGEVGSMMGIGIGGSVGLTWSAPFVVALGAALASVAAEFLPLVTYRVSPGALRVIGGAAATAAWLHGTAPAAAAQAGASRPLVGSDVREDPAPTPSPNPDTGEAAQQESPASEVPEPIELAPAVPTDGAAGPVLPAPRAESEEAAPGIPLHAGAAGPATQPDLPELPQRAPMTPRAKRTLLAVGIAVASLALIAIAAAITVSSLNAQRDPAAAVEKYLDLLADGKAEQASKLVDPGLRNEDRVLLTDSALAAAEHRITVVRVETDYRAESSAEVTATLSLDGERFTRSFTVNAGPKEFMLLDTWELAEPFLVQASVSGAGVDALAVGDAEVQLETSPYGGDFGSRELFLYPGIYTVTAPGNDFVDVSTESLRAGPDTVTGPVEVTVTQSAQFEEAVLQQVQERLSQCVTIPTNMDDVCPYRTQRKDLAEMTVVSQIEGFEQISLTGFDSSEGTIAVRPNPQSFDPDPELEESTVTVRGAIEFVDGQPKISELFIW